MPNWCYNKLSVKGSAKQVALFESEQEGSGPEYPGLGAKELLTFNSAVPVPVEIQDGPYDPVGYDWQINNWGTKWGPCDIIRQQVTPAHLLYNFDTAWSPPSPWFAALAKRYPTLHLDMYSIEEQPSFIIQYSAYRGQLNETSHMGNHVNNDALSAAEIRQIIKNFGHGPVWRGLICHLAIWRTPSLTKAALAQLVDPDEVSAVLGKIPVEEQILVITHLMETNHALLGEVISSAAEYGLGNQERPLLDVVAAYPLPLRRRLAAFAIKSQARPARVFGISLIASLKNQAPPAIPRSPSH